MEGRLKSGIWIFWIFRIGDSELKFLDFSVINFFLFVLERYCNIVYFMRFVGRFFEKGIKISVIGRFLFLFF